MVMPFRRKPVVDARPGAPRELDCDRLWDLVFRPLIDELGYVPVRADLESGSVVIKQMLDRLKHSDLVIADLSLQNGNVYYELGVRHVARTTQCVQVAADWFKPMFDLAQFRTLTYPLRDGEVPDSEANAIRTALVQRIPGFRAGRTPYHELVSPKSEAAFEEEARRLGAFQAELSAARLSAPGAARSALVTALVDRHSAAAKLAPGVATELLFLVRDTLDWNAVLAFVASLPAWIRESEAIEEQRCLALSKAGNHPVAIAALEALIHRHGATPERCGLLGGSWKRQHRDARREREASGSTVEAPGERHALKQAIAAYDRGRLLDLNEYYCSSNLPGLLRQRAARGDEERAAEVEAQVIAACHRAKHAGRADEWLEPTLFGIAFRRGEVDRLEELAAELEGGVPWKLATTLADASEWIRQAPIGTRDELTRVLARLRAACNEGG